jgi:hypothetical protein
MSPFERALLLGLAVGLAGCGGIKKTFDGWVKSDEGDAAEAKDATPPSIVRPESVQGLIPSSDKAAHAAQKLHRQLHPGQNADRVIATTAGDSGTVQIYMDKAKPGEVPEKYWVGRKTDGLWYAFHKIPTTENFKFVLEHVAKEHLKTRHPDKLMVHEFQAGGGAKSREVRIRYSDNENVYTRKLSMEKDPDAGWTVVKDEAADSVYGP